VDNVVDVLSRRGDHQLAVETDPLALEEARLARMHTLQKLTCRLREIDGVLACHLPRSRPNWPKPRGRWRHSTTVAALEKAKRG
jgi:hypothetical protein